MCLGNHSEPRIDLIDVTDPAILDCAAATALVSARLDGELGDSSPENAALEVHLAGCPDCRAWQERAFSLRRLTTMRAARPVEEPSAAARRVLVRAGVPNPGAGDWVRYVLGVVAAIILLMNLPLLLGIGDGPTTHDDRHLGAFGVALGAGLFWAAVRPERSIGLIPLAAALAATMAVGAVVDLADHQSTMLSESVHLLEAAGLGLLWYLSGGPRRLAARHLPALRRSSPPRVRAVTDTGTRRGRLTTSWDVKGFVRRPLRS